MTQVNLRLPEDLKKTAESFARKYGYASIQELTKEALREKVYNKESLKETLEIMGNKKLMKSIRRGLSGKGVSLDSYLKKRGLR